MSLIGRISNDYSPLKAPPRDPRMDTRSKKERRQYEQAVNARREMLEVISSQIPHKLTKKERERYARMPPSCVRAKGETMEHFITRQSNATASAKAIIRRS